MDRAWQPMPRVGRGGREGHLCRALCLRAEVPWGGGVAGMQKAVIRSPSGWGWEAVSKGCCGREGGALELSGWPWARCADHLEGAGWQWGQGGRQDGGGWLGQAERQVKEAALLSHHNGQRAVYARPISPLRWPNARVHGDAQAALLPTPIP